MNSSKIAKFIYWATVITLTGLILCSCNHSQRLVNSYQQVLPAVVTISGDKTYDKTNEIQNVGTGFFIAPRYVLTVAHVVDRIVDGTIELRFWNKQIISAKKIATDKFNDLALLQIDSDVKVPKLNFNTHPQVGESVFMIGSPNSFYGTLTQGIFSRGTLKRNALNWYWSCEVYLIDAICEGGNSGSPVFNARCEIIGVVSGYFGSFTVVIPSYSIRAFLKESIGY